MTLAIFSPSSKGNRLTIAVPVSYTHLDVYKRQMMGFFTAVGGGMLRDGVMGVVPGIFQRTNFYAIAAIAGSTSYVLSLIHI